MSKGIKIALSVLTAYAVLAFSHLWLNIGFDSFRTVDAREAEKSFRVGFLPVT